MFADEESRSEETAAAPAAAILVVDDDDRIRYLLSTVLRKQGYGVVTAENGKEALRYLKQNPAPRLILSDLVMPDMNGPQFRMALEQDPALAAIPVVIMSGTQNTRAEAFFLNAAGHLDKPIDLEALMELARRFCS